MRDSDIIEKIRGANLPPYVERNTLPGMGFPQLRRVITDRSFYDKENRRFSCYLIEGDDKKTRQAAVVFGKEMLLSKAAVYCASFAGVIREIRQYDRKDEDQLLSPVLSHLRGKSMVVLTGISDLFDEPQAGHQLLEALDVLQSHIHAGGGLVLSTASYSEFGHPFDDLVESFTKVQV